MVVLEGFSEFLKLFGKDVRLGEVVELRGSEAVTHAIEVHIQAILAGELGRVDEVVDLLVVCQVIVGLLLVNEGVAGPEQRPRLAVGCGRLHVVCFENLLDYKLVAIHLLVRGILRVIIIVL